MLPVFLSFPPKMRQHEKNVCPKQFFSVIRFFAGKDISRKIDKLKKELLTFMLLIFDEEVSFDFDRMMVVSPCRTLYILTLASTLRRYVVTSCASNQRKNVFLRNFCCFISIVFLGIILFNTIKLI